MAEKREFLVNSALLLLIVSLVAYLVIDVRRSRNDLENIGVTGDKVIRGVIVQGPPAHPFEPYSAALFNDNNHFDPIVTPLPSSTPPPQPTPTATPLPTPQWQVITIMGNVVQVRDKFGKFHYLKVGETLEQYQIVETDQAGKQVRVRSVDFGNEVWIAVGDERKPKDAQPRRPRTPR